MAEEIFGSSSLSAFTMDHRSLFTPHPHTVSLAFVESTEIVSIVFGVVSAVASFLVLLTGMLFPSMVRNKIFSQMIMLISANNLLNSLGSSLGYEIHEGLCVFQAIFKLFGMKGAWCLMVLMSFQLRNLVNKGSVTFNLKQIIYIYALFQLLSMILPYLMGSWYGIMPKDKGLLACTLAAETDVDMLHAVLINIDSFAFVMLAILCYNNFKLFRDVAKLRETTNPEAMIKIEEVKWSACLYPIFMIIVWFPLLLFIFIDVFAFRPKDPSGHQSPHYVITAIFWGGCWANLDGFFNCVVFFYNGIEARRRWSHLLKQYAMGRAYLTAFKYISMNTRHLLSICDKYFPHCCCCFDSDELRDEGSFSAYSSGSKSIRRRSYNNSNGSIPKETTKIDGWASTAINADELYDTVEDFEDDARLSEALNVQSRTSIAISMTPQTGRSSHVSQGITFSGKSTKPVVSALHEDRISEQLSSASNNGTTQVPRSPIRGPSYETQSSNTATDVETVV